MKTPDGSVALSEITHRSQSSLEPTMVSLDPLVACCVLSWCDPGYRSSTTASNAATVGHSLARYTMAGDCDRKELPSGPDVAAW